MDGSFENIVDWVRSILHLDLTNCTVDSYMSIPKDVIKVVNDMGKQEITSDRIQLRNRHHKLILLDLFVDNDRNDDDSCASDTDQKIGKNLETYLMKIELDMDIDNNEINDLNDKDAVHLNDGLAVDYNIDIEDSRVQHKQDDQHNHFGIPVENKL